MGGTRCKMFSHGPMSGAGGAKGLVWYIFSYAKGAKLGPGGTVAPPGLPLDPLLNNGLTQCSGTVQFDLLVRFHTCRI